MGDEEKPHPNYEEITACWNRAVESVSDTDADHEDITNVLAGRFEEVSRPSNAYYIVWGIFDDAIAPLMKAVHADERGEVKNSFTKIIRDETQKLRDLRDRQPEMRQQYDIAINEVNAAARLALSKEYMTREQALLDNARQR